MVIMLSGSVMLVKPHWRNAWFDIVVTEDGIVIELSPLQPWNAKSPMVVTEDGIVKVPVFPAGQVSRLVLVLLYNMPLLELYLGLSGDIFIEVSLRQPLYVDIIEYQLFMINTIEKWSDVY